MTIPTELPKPLNDDDFERLCLEVYRVVFNDPLPETNGRNGQAQAGADSYFFTAAGERIAVQAKRYNKGGLSQQLVQDEINRAENGSSAIGRLLIATTAPSDARLRRFVHTLSDARTAANKFGVGIDFWEEITAHIRRHPELQEQFEPHAPGTTLRRLEQRQHLSNLKAEERHAQILEQMDQLQRLMEQGGVEKQAPPQDNQHPTEETVTLPIKVVTVRSQLLYLTLDQLAISHLERQRHTTYERRVTIRTADGEVFLDALRQDDDLPADQIVEVRWLRKRYLDAPVWAAQVTSKVKLYELLTGRAAVGTLLFVVPDKLGDLDELPYSRDAITQAEPPIAGVIATYSNIGFDPGPISAAVFASNTRWKANLFEADPLNGGVICRARQFSP